jgi:hypothetical protein
MRKACARYADAILMECPAMLARSIVIAGTLTAAAAAFAEPPKPQAQAASQPSNRPLVLASADSVKTPTTDADQQAPAKKPRVARVTTCRCGDQVPQDDSGEE